MRSDKLQINNMDKERIDKRARSINAMGLVSRDGDRFKVLKPMLRGNQPSNKVWRDENGKIRCNCLDFESEIINDSTFRCEHILAVKYFLTQKSK